MLNHRCVCIKKQVSFLDEKGSDRKKKHPDEEIKDDNDQLKKIEELNHKLASLEEKIDVYARN